MISSKFLASALLSAVAITNLQVSAGVNGFVEARFACEPCYQIASARQRIEAHLPQLSDPAIIAALAVAASRGVAVEVVSTQEAAADRRGLLHHLIRSGVPVTLTERPVTYEIRVDGHLVSTQQPG